MKLQLNKEIQSDRRGFLEAASRARSVLQKSVDFILPPRCALSGKVVSQQGEIIPEEWGKARIHI